MKIVETVSGSVTSTKQFIGNEERDGSGTVTKQFFPKGQRNGSTNYFYGRDHLSSVRTMTDNTGVSVSDRTFDPFGRATVFSETVAPDFGFAGMYYHARSGLNLTPARAYLPSLGRWISRDPIAEDGGINLYAYVSGDPINFRDPYGLQAAESSYTDCLEKCLNQALLTAGAIGGTAALVGAPIVPKRFVTQANAAAGAPRASAKSSIATTVLRKAIPFNFPFGIKVSAPTAAVPNATTGKVGVALGRWVPKVGYAAPGIGASVYVGCILSCKGNVPVDLVPSSPVCNNSWGWHTTWHGVDYTSASANAWGWHTAWHEIDVGNDGDISDSNLSTPFPNSGFRWL